MTTTSRTGNDWVERVRTASDIVEVIGERVALKRVGRNWTGLCPFHSDKTPSFSVHAERQFYHCFSCKAGGDVFKFIQELEHVEFLDAVEMLSRRANLPIPDRRAESRGLRAPLLEALEAATLIYEQCLADPELGAAARAALERRGIARETVKAFRLGFSPAAWDTVTGRLRGKFRDDVLVEARLAGRREAGPQAAPGAAPRLYDWFRGRLMVPLIGSAGAVVGFGARALAADDEPKYLNSPESAVYHKGSFLFGLEAARREVAAGGEMIVVEGYFDAIALHQAGLRHTVATSGTALTADQARMLKRLAPRVALTYDGDRAGREAMMRSLGTLLAEGLEVRVVTLPDGDDPDSMVRRSGIPGWEEVRRAALDPAEFVQRHVLQARGAGGSAESREAAAQAIVRLAASIGDPVRVRLLLERGSELIGVPLAVLARSQALQPGGPPSQTPIATAVARRREREESIERRLLQALLQAPAELDAARERLSPEDFRDPACAALALGLWNGGEIPDEAQALSRELQAQDAHLNWTEEARGAIRRLQVRRLQDQLRERKEQLRGAHSPDQLQRLQRETDDIAESLRALSSSPDLHR